MKLVLFCLMSGLVGFILGRILPRKSSSQVKQTKTDFKITDEMIIRFANMRTGIISAHELATQTSLTLDEAQKRLENLVAKQIAELRVSDSGQILFDFTKNQPNSLDKIKSEKI
ncbi:MAG: hypothetical protein RMJ97_01940 [Raineya sp.]|nr:hypothetical protein [Raineya sp.]MDW8295619.1 hypothetical protein [Raineya sp.]